MTEFLKRQKLLLLVLLVAALFRLPYLDRLPPGISDDELMYVADAKAIWLTGRSMTSDWSPFGLVKGTNEFPHTELPHLILSPFMGILPFSLSTAHLPYAISSIVLSGVLFLFMKKLTDAKTAFWVGIASAVNPWLIFFGRTSFDATLAISFFMISIATLIYARGWKILLTTIPLILAFGTYLGTKVLFIPFVVVSFVFAWIMNRKRDTKWYILSFLICLSVFIYYVMSLRSMTIMKRSNELFTPTSESVVATVDMERRLSLVNPITDRLVNKMTIYLRSCIDKFFLVYSPTTLFTNGDYRATFSLYRHGYFYYIDFFLIIVGAYSLYKKRRTLFFYLTSLLLIAPIPAIASQAGNGFSGIRGLILYPTLTIYIGVGITSLLSWAKKKTWGTVFFIGFFLSYFVLIMNFLIIYALQYPIYSSESYSVSSRIMAKYLSLALKENKHVVVYSTSAKAKFIYFLFHANEYSRNNAPSLQKQFEHHTYEFGSIRFLPCEGDIIPDPNITYIVEAGGCDVMTSMRNPQEKTIPILSDGGSVYHIIGDHVCDGFHLSRYPTNIRFSDLSIEHLSLERFCTTYITQMGNE